jgi:hypothetical protein
MSPRVSIIGEYFISRFVEISQDIAGAACDRHDYRAHATFEHPELDHAHDLGWEQTCLA